jgi:hypothetical protein
MDKPYTLPPVSQIQLRLQLVPTYQPPVAELEEADTLVDLSDVDSLFAAAELTEEEEWDVRRQLAKGRAKLEGL